MSNIVNEINGIMQRPKEVTSTADLLLGVLKMAFMREQEIAYCLHKDNRVRMSCLFDENFRTDMMHLL